MLTLGLFYLPAYLDLILLIMLVVSLATANFAIYLKPIWFRFIVAELGNWLASVTLLASLHYPSYDFGAAYQN